MNDHLNAHRLRQAYDAFGRGDLDSLLAMLTPDVTFVVDLGPLGGTYTGKDDVPRFFGKMAELYHGTLRVDVVDIVAANRHGIVLTHESGTVHGGKIYWTSAHVWSFTHGDCDHFTAYVSADYQRFWVGERPTTAR